MAFLTHLVLFRSSLRSKQFHLFSLRNEAWYFAAPNIYFKKIPLRSSFITFNLVATMKTEV